MSSAPAVRGVLFDWGGTLSRWADVDLLDLWQAAARSIDADRAEELTQRLLAVEAAMWRRTETTQQSTTLSDVLAEATRALGVDVAEAVLEEAATHHLDAWTPHIAHDPEAVPTLRGLRERGLRTGLLSNTMWPRTFHDRFLERDGLLDLLEVRRYTSEMIHTKPHPSVFCEAVTAMGVDDRGAVVFVGDRPIDDIAGAKGAGLRAVLRAGGDMPAGEVAPDAEISALPELLDLVDGWR